MGVPLAEGIWSGIARGRMLRYETLRTLLHEVGHHFDRVCRVARGRWRAGPSPRAETYARDRERAWSRTVLEPFMVERYPHGDALMGAYADRVKARGGNPLAFLRWGL